MVVQGVLTAVVRGAGLVQRTPVTLPHTGYTRHAPNTHTHTHTQHSVNYGEVVAVCSDVTYREVVLCSSV